MQPDPAWSSRRVAGVRLALALVLAACGGSSPGTARPAAATGPSADADAAPAPLDASAPVVTNTDFDDWHDEHVQPASCARMQAAFAALARCAGLTAAQAEQLQQARAVAVASYTEACMDEQCPEEGDQAVREDEACTRALDGLTRLALPCPLPP